MSELITDDERKKNSYHFDRHTAEYRLQFEKITEEMQRSCPVAWSDTTPQQRRRLTPVLPGS